MQLHKEHYGHDIRDSHKNISIQVGCICLFHVTTPIPYPNTPWLPLSTWHHLLFLPLQVTVDQMSSDIPFYFSYSTCIPIPCSVKPTSLWLLVSPSFMLLIPTKNKQTKKNTNIIRYNLTITFWVGSPLPNRRWGQSTARLKVRAYLYAALLLQQQLLPSFPHIHTILLIKYLLLLFNYQLGLVSMSFMKTSLISSVKNWN